MSAPRYPLARLVARDGRLYVATQMILTEPIARTLYWPTGLPAGGALDCYVGYDLAWQHRWADGFWEIQTRTGVDGRIRVDTTGESIVEEEPIPPPVTKRQCRWNESRQAWETYTKRTGWVIGVGK